LRVVAPDGAGEGVSFAVARTGYGGGVKHAVHAVEPAVGAPGEAVWQLVSVLAAEAGEEHFFRVGDVVAVGVLEEQHVGRVGDVDAAVAVDDPAGDVEAFLKDLDRLEAAVVVLVLEDADAVAALAGLLARV